MKLATPRWWYVRDRAPAPITRLLLRPLSWLWASATRSRIARGEPFDPGVPVISVGNLTVGGSGKTPAARELLRRLRAAGVDAHGLSRGYGGSLKGPARVDPEHHRAAEVGDEPLMMAADATIWVARDRAAGARAAVGAGAVVLVLDDGHQNPSLAKRLSLVVVDGDTREGEWPFGDGSVFPAGPMREPLDVGLARADAVIVLLPGGVDRIDPALANLLAPKPILIARLAASDAPPPGPQLGFAGVAKPWRVERSLRDAGVELVDFAPFPDHAAFRPSDLVFLTKRAALFDAGLITTEKDWARLTPQWRRRVRAWPVRAVFEDEAELDRLLSSAIDSRAPAAELR